MTPMVQPEGFTLLSVLESHNDFARMSAGHTLVRTCDSMDARRDVRLPLLPLRDNEHAGFPER